MSLSELRLAWGCPFAVQGAQRDDEHHGIESAAGGDGLHRCGAERADECGGQRATECSVGVDPNLASVILDLRPVRLRFRFI